jgi:hypothetical protein
MGCGSSKTKEWVERNIMEPIDFAARDPHPERTSTVVPRNVSGEQGLGQQAREQAAQNGVGGCAGNQPDGENLVRNSR